MLKRYRKHANKQKRKGVPNRKGNISISKSQMSAMAQKRKPITSPQLREGYSAKIEWARKLLPKLKKEEA